MKIKQYLVTLCAVFLIFLLGISAAAAGGYTDVSEDFWGREDIVWATEQGLMKGVGDNAFAPLDSVTRGMMVTVLWRMEGSPAANEANPFEDVPAGSWYEDAIRWAYETTLVNGVSATSFEPDSALTREQAATFFYRYARFLGRDISARAELSAFSDENAVQSWAKDALSWAVAGELILGIAEPNGGSILQPGGIANRAQLAALLHRINVYLETCHSADDHSFGGWSVVQEATWDKEGQEQRICGRCSHSESRDIQPLSSEEYRQLVRDYGINNETGYKKYTATTNPLLAESRPINTGVKSYFDLDTTGFVKNDVKLADLKGREMVALVSGEDGAFIYRGANGEVYDEITWLEDLEETYGLKVKVVRCQENMAVTQTYTYIMSAKKMDLVTTHRDGFPLFLNLAQALDPYIEFKNLKYSPGVDKKFMLQTQWKDAYRCIAPLGDTDVIWYNQTMVDQLGLEDPHTLWQKGEWDWNSWKAFLESVPRKNPEGKSLSPWYQHEKDAIACWPLTNRVRLFDNLGSLTNNFDDPRCKEAWQFYTETVKGVDYLERGESVDLWEDMWINGQCIMAATGKVMYNWEQYDYAKNHQYNWVPYPQADDNYCGAISYGRAMILPKKIAEERIPYAIKVAELWATRFTEAAFDYQRTSPYLAFSSEQRKEYFNYVIMQSQTYIGAQILPFTSEYGNYYNRFLTSFYNDQYDVLTEAERLKNYIDQAIAQVKAYASEI